ncbi:MAG: tetratricopeptide repeat protein [Aridibacter sp.]
MKSNSLKTYIAVAVIIFGFVAVFSLSNFLEKHQPPMPENYIDEDLSLQGEKLKGYSFGFEGLLADWYWMRSLQYIGDKVVNSKENLDLENLKPLNPKLLYPLLENAATLDPQFLEVYSYGAVVLPAINPEQAIEFTEKGIANNPDEWRLYQHLGYIYWKLNKYAKAAEVYQKGSEIKDAPPFMKLMAAKMKNEGGSRETARQIYRQMLDEAQDTQIKENAKIRLLELDSFNERDAIQKVLTQFKEQKGRCANDWQEIFPLLQNVKLPDGKDFRVDDKGNIVDPTDAPYLLDKEHCEIKLDLEKTKLPRQ